MGVFLSCCLCLTSSTSHDIIALVISAISEDISHVLDVSMTQMLDYFLHRSLHSVQNVLFLSLQQKQRRKKNPRHVDSLTQFSSTNFPSPPGVRHSNIICDSCKKHGIMGMRWKCKVCFDYDLCTQCYMNNKHDLGHAFERYETAHSQP